MDAAQQFGYAYRSGQAAVLHKPKVVGRDHHMCFALMNRNFVRDLQASRLPEFCGLGLLGVVELEIESHLPAQASTDCFLSSCCLWPA